MVWGEMNNSVDGTLNSLNIDFINPSITCSLNFSLQLIVQILLFPGSLPLHKSTGPGVSGTQFIY